MTAELYLWIALAYLLGAVPFGVVVAKLYGGTDPRTAGSKNIGATNVGRLLGKKAGLTTLALDILKGFLPVYAATGRFGGALFPALVGGAAFAGHLFPVYLKFRGGKGIATGAGVFLALSPLSLLASALIFAALTGLTRMVSLGSVVASLALPFAAHFLKEPRETVLLAAAVAVFAVIKHRANIQRIISGTESRLGGGK